MNKKNFKIPKPKESDYPKRSTAERKKSFGRFKDKLKKNFGNPFQLVGICLRGDCVNRDIKCDVCIRHSEYKNV